VGAAYDRDVNDSPPWVLAAAGPDARSARRARWGFRHETWIVDLSDGGRRVFQRRSDGSDPGSADASTIRSMIRATGLPTPEPIRVDPGGLSDGDMVLELPYVDGLVAAELLGTPEGAAACGRCCGGVAAALAGARVTPAGLPATWASSRPLVEAGRTWLASCDGVLGSGQAEAIEGVLVRAARLVDEAPSLVAHGDLAPVNVLVRGTEIAAVLDLDRVQLAHPIYDAAWFSWVVSFHHPDVAVHACDAFAATAGTPAHPTAVSWLWPLLLLERLAEAASPGERATWTARLSTSLAGA
jgi:hypothetical protein